MNSKQKKYEVCPVSLDHLDAIEQIALRSQDGIRPNTRMIYYLGCTLFQPYSLVLQENQHVVGFLLALPGEAGKLLWIHQIAVDPDFRLRGYGHKLMEAAFALAVNNGVKSLRLAVNPKNEALSWYINLGFKELERSKEIGMLIMEKTLT